MKKGERLVPKEKMVHLLDKMRRVAEVKILFIEITFNIYNMTKLVCEICHKREATTTVWLAPEQSSIKVGGRYRAFDPCSGKKK